MERSVRRILSTIIIVILLVFLVLMEFSLRFAGWFSLSVDDSISATIKNHPLVFGSLWMVAMVSVVYVTYIKYSEKKTKAKLVELILWLVFLLAGLTYGLCRVF